MVFAIAATRTTCKMTCAKRGYHRADDYLATLAYAKFVEFPKYSQNIPKVLFVRSLVRSFIHSFTH